MFAPQWLIPAMAASLVVMFVVLCRADFSDASDIQGSLVASCALALVTSCVTIVILSGMNNDSAWIFCDIVLLLAFIAGAITALDESRKYVALRITCAVGAFAVYAFWATMRSMC